MAGLRIGKNRTCLMGLTFFCVKFIKFLLLSFKSFDFDVT